MKLSFTRKKNLAEDEAPKRRAEDMASDLAAPTPKRRLSDQMPGTASAAGVMQFNGKSYAVGLLWFTVQEDSNKKLLAKRIEKTRADFTCLRQHISQQQGFGWLEKGHRRGMPAAAAMIADQLVGEWHGVFEAENGWWYVQVRSDT
ncbi:MAG: pilin accessory family protein, partial [Alphaproteobacteria bacterium]|nr:pilin accessory family protein [Alphaproteobacteria bacterium]